MKDGAIEYASADGPFKFYKKGYCRFCECEQLIDMTTHRCEKCHTEQV